MAEVDRHLILHIGKLADELLAGHYRPETGRCFHIKKANGSERIICAPSVRDKLVQRAVLTVLEPLGEAVFHDSSYGYRPLCTLDMALSRLREWIRLGYVWLGDADVVQCFDSIPHHHALLALRNLCQDEAVTNLVRFWVERAPQWTRPRGRGYGLPQGMVLSPFLCNVYLHRWIWHSRRQASLLCVTRMISSSWAKPRRRRSRHWRLQPNVYASWTFGSIRTRLR